MSLGSGRIGMRRLPGTSRVRPRTLVTTIASLACCVAAAPACWAAGKIYYGSRAGMQVTVVGVSGIGTRTAVVRVRHTPEDAKAFCVEYSNDASRACVERTLRETRLNDEITGDCVSGRFTTLYGENLRFVGEARNAADGDPKYVLLRRRERLDGSSASGYGYDLEQFAALCPSRAMPER